VQTFFGRGSCTQTETGSENWWEVDLESEYAIDNVVVWNR
jgi:hypothetical protein